MATKNELWRTHLKSKVGYQLLTPTAAAKYLKNIHKINLEGPQMVQKVKNFLKDARKQSKTQSKMLGKSLAVTSSEEAKGQPIVYRELKIKYEEALVIIETLEKQHVEDVKKITNLVQVGNDRDAKVKAVQLLLSGYDQEKPVDYQEQLRAYTKALQDVGRDTATIARDAGLVKNFLTYIFEHQLPFRSDSLNKYLGVHYQTYYSKKRAGNEIVRFSLQVLGMSEGQIRFLKPIKPIGGDEKIVMSTNDNECMLTALGKVKSFKLVEGHNDRYRAALLLILCTGCRPNEACKTASHHFSYDKVGKIFSLALPKKITKTSEDYKWQLPMRFNHVWRAMQLMSDKLERLDYYQLRK